MSSSPENNFGIQLPDFEGGFGALVWSWGTVDDDDYSHIYNHDDCNNNLSPFSSPNDSQQNPTFNSPTTSTLFVNSNSPGGVDDLIINSPTFSVASSVIVSSDPPVISTPHSATGNYSDDHDNNTHDLTGHGYATGTPGTSTTSNDNDHNNNINDKGTRYNIFNVEEFHKTSSADRSSLVSIMEERRRRRMISNRESARRSRMRKQRHLEKLRAQANRLKLENREWANRLRFVLHHYYLAQRDNHRLAAEAVVLHHRLTQIAPFLQVQY